jgi:hypothetical protein
MIKDAEVAMVHAASYALEAQDRNIGAGVEEIIKHFLQDFKLEIKSNVKIYSIASINEIMKIKMNRENKGKSNKQLLQIFVKNIPDISRRLQEEESN